MSPKRSRASADVTARARRALGDRRTKPNVDWVVRLTGASRAQVTDALAEADALTPFEVEIHTAHERAGRALYAQIRAPFELYALTRLLAPEHVVETGVSSGVSSAHFLLALVKNQHGLLHSIDKPTFQKGTKLRANESSVALPPGRRSGWAVPEGLKTGWDLRIGFTQKLLPDLVRELPSIGVFLHDDLHTPRHLTFELETIRPKLVPGAVVLADNTVWTGDAFPRFARSLGAPWFRRGRTDLVGLRVPRSAPRAARTPARPRR
jgi:hypothetical protein